MDTVKDDNVGLSSDESRLISLGHKPELKRTYNFWSCKFHLGSYDEIELMDANFLSHLSDGVSNYDSLLMVV